jgi:hypothetical protein
VGFVAIIIITLKTYSYIFHLQLCGDIDTALDGACHRAKISVETMHLFSGFSLFRL